MFLAMCVYFYNTIATSYTPMTNTSQPQHERRGFVCVPKNTCRPASSCRYSVNGHCPDFVDVSTHEPMGTDSDWMVHCTHGHRGDAEQYPQTRPRMAGARRAVWNGLPCHMRFHPACSLVSPVYFTQQGGSSVRDRRERVSSGVATCLVYAVGLHLPPGAAPHTETHTRPCDRNPVLSRGHRACSLCVCNACRTRYYSKPVSGFHSMCRRGSRAECGVWSVRGPFSPRK